MTIAFVNSALANATSVASVTTPAFVATAGNLIVVGAVWNNDEPRPTVTDTAGNTYINCDPPAFAAQPTGAGPTAAIYYANNILGNASNQVTVDWGEIGAYRRCNASQYSGAHRSSPFAGIGGFGSDAVTGTVITTSSFTVLNPHCLAVEFGGTSAGRTWTAGSGYTIRGAANTGNVLADRINPPLGAQTASLTIDVTNTNREIVAVIFSPEVLSPALYGNEVPRKVGYAYRERFLYGRGFVATPPWLDEAISQVNAHPHEYPTSTGVDISAARVRFRTGTDATGSGTSDAITVPVSGYSFSREKWLRLHVMSGPYSSLSNLRFYKTGTMGGSAANYRLSYRLVTGTPPTYASPVRPADDVAFPAAGFTNAEGFTSPGAALTINAGEWNSASATGPGANQPYLVLDLGVKSGAAGGILSSESYVWLFDEVS
jgi:hypothetical protein